MPKHQVNIADRVAEFKSEGFVISAGILLCKHCNYSLDYRRKDALHKHCKSEKHIKRKANEQGDSRVVTLEEFILDTVEAFVTANIPVEKLDHPAIREWMNKYVHGSSDLPLANGIRQHYIPIVGNKKREEIATDVKDKYVFIFCDETTDRNGNCIFNIILRPSTAGHDSKTHLAASVVLDTANAANCANAVLDTLQHYGIEQQHAVAVVTDSARYMTQCAETLKGLIESLHHVQCWAHKVNNIGSVLEDQMDDLNTAVVKVKNAFLNTRKRKSKYLHFLREKYQGTDKEHLIALFPSPVRTRWNSWFTSVQYLATHLEDIVDFFKSLDDGNAGVLFFHKATSATIHTVKLEAVFVADVCPPFMDLLAFLEGSSYPTTHLLAGKLKDIEVKLQLLSEGVFSESVLEELQHVPSALKTAVQSKLRNASDIVLEKLDEHKTQDPAKHIIDSIGALFDPRNIATPKSAAELVKIQSNVPFLNKVSPQAFLEGHTIFLNAVREQLQAENCIAIDIIGILSGLKLSHKEYAVAAIKSLWFPCSIAYSERSFSNYSLVVSDRRRRLTAANAETLTMVAFE